VIRLDDVGAATKEYRCTVAGQLLGRREWAPYPEIDAGTWDAIGRLLHRGGHRILVAVTACWVYAPLPGRYALIPFPQRWPAAADALKELHQGGLVEIANHGLAHWDGVTDPRPRWFRSNRPAWREFRAHGGEWEVTMWNRCCRRLEEAQAILGDWLGRSPTVFVPPGHDASGFPDGMNWRRRGIHRVLGPAPDAYHDRDLALAPEGPLAWLTAHLSPS